MTWGLWIFGSRHRASLRAVDIAIPTIGRLDSHWRKRHVEMALSGVASVPILSPPFGKKCRVRSIIPPFTAPRLLCFEYVGPLTRASQSRLLPTPNTEEFMRAIGIVLIIVGILALAVPSFTFFTTERAVDTSFLTIDTKKPHTIILNPIVGVVATIAGIVLVFAGGRKARSV